MKQKSTFLFVSLRNYTFLQCFGSTSGSTDQIEQIQFFFFLIFFCKSSKTNNDFFWFFLKLIIHVHILNKIVISF